MSDKSAAEEALRQQAEKERAAERGRTAAGTSRDEAHAEGEPDKPTARDATGEKQEGFKDEDEEDDSEAAEREHLRKQAGSSLP